MKTSTIFTEKAVSSTEARKHFKECISGSPVVVLSNNEPAGYMMSADFFEGLMRALEAKGYSEASSFRPASARLEAIAHLNTELLLNMSDDELGDFLE